jgi:glycolate oxidase
MSDQVRENPSAFLSGLREILGDKGLLTDDAARLVYARDASHLTLGCPLAVALPGDAFQLRRVVGLCRAVGVPVVCRGSGTGLSGGAVPCGGALVVGTSRLTDLGPVDSLQRRVRVQPGVLNDGVSRHASASGLHFAPDPSSQSAALSGGLIWCPCYAAARELWGW